MQHLKSIDEESIASHPSVNTLRPRENGNYFKVNIFKWIFLNENVWIPIQIF